LTLSRDGPDGFESPNDNRVAWTHQGRDGDEPGGWPLRGRIAFRWTPVIREYWLRSSFRKSRSAGRRAAISCVTCTV
jgi:hypothetical protein